MTDYIAHNNNQQNFQALTNQKIMPQSIYKAYLKILGFSKFFKTYIEKNTFGNVFPLIIIGKMQSYLNPEKSFEFQKIANGLLNQNVEVLQCPFSQQASRKTISFESNGSVNRLI